jgi:hypothetical protein
MVARFIWPRISTAQSGIERALNSDERSAINAICLGVRLKDGQFASTHQQLDDGNLRGPRHLVQHDVRDDELNGQSRRLLQESDVDKIDENIGVTDRELHPPRSTDAADRPG